MIETKITCTGPVFDGRAEVVAHQYSEHTQEVIGQEAVNRIRQQLPWMYKQSPSTSTGHYESQIQTERQVDDVSVNDSCVVYGPWLEGVSERNKATRFKGYHIFRRISDEMGAGARELAEAELPPYVLEM